MKRAFPDEKLTCANAAHAKRHPPPTVGKRLREEYALNVGPRLEHLQQLAPATFSGQFLQQFGLTSLDQLPGTTLGEQPTATEPVTQAPAENANGTGAVSPVALETNKEHSEEH